MPEADSLAAEGGMEHYFYNQKQQKNDFKNRNYSWSRYVIYQVHQVNFVLVIM